MAVFSGIACSDQTDKTDFKAEAKALCDAFNPATWDADFQKFYPAEKATMLQQKIQAAIHSEAMTKIYRKLATDRPEKAYSNYTRNVSDLIGEQHTCPSIQNYFSF